MTASYPFGPRASFLDQLRDKIAYREELLGRLELVEQDIQKIRERLI